MKKNSLEFSHPKSPIYSPFMAIQKYLKRCDCWKLFSKIPSGNRLEALCNQLQALKFEFKILIVCGLLIVDKDRSCC